MALNVTFQIMSTKSLATGLCGRQGTNSEQHRGGELGRLTLDLGVIMLEEEGCLTENVGSYWKVASNWLGQVKRVREGLGKSRKGNIKNKESHMAICTIICLWCIRATWIEHHKWTKIRTIGPMEEGFCGTEWLYGWCQLLPDILSVDLESDSLNEEAE